MDVETVLLSVEERDKWRHRLKRLEEALFDVRDRRLRLERRLHRIKTELAHLAEISEAAVDPTRLANVGPFNAATRTNLPSR